MPIGLWRQFWILQPYVYYQSVKLGQNSQQFELGSNYYHSTLAASAEMIFFLEMMKFSKTIFLKEVSFSEGK
jgi:hypothetical protein